MINFSRNLILRVSPLLKFIAKKFWALNIDVPKSNYIHSKMETSSGTLVKAVIKTSRTIQIRLEYKNAANWGGQGK